MRGLDGFRWRLANWRAKRNRADFASTIRSTSVETLLGDSASAETRDFQLVSFSGARDFEEQVLSLMTFRRWLGTPRSWTIFSDGTHTDEMRELLGAQFPWATLRSWELSKPLVPETANFLFSYADEQAMGKRLIAYSTFPLEEPTLFLDSDVLFYSKATELLPPAFVGTRHWFLPDMDWGSLDSRFLAKNTRDHYQSNGGFFLLKPGFSWKPVLDFLERLENKFEYFSDQTAFHVAFKEQDALAFDPRVFILHWNDQFALGLNESPGQMAIRHFVAMVRHKIWEPGWRWHLGL
jgi:hypothetical protein